ncbi:hypothetical protein ACFLU6_16645 [Acidobacteriota bacterium]
MKCPSKAITKGLSNDVRKLVRPVLKHRLITNFQADASGIEVDEIIEKLLNAIKT